MPEVQVAGSPRQGLAPLRGTTQDKGAVRLSIIAQLGKTVEGAEEEGRGGGGRGWAGGVTENKNNLLPRAGPPTMRS